MAIYYATVGPGNVVCSVSVLKSATSPSALTSIPNVVQITADQYNQVNQQGTKYALSGGVLSAVGPTPGPSLQNTVSSALAQIDQQAEIQRSQYLTAGTGMCAIYAEKAAEAKAFLAAYPTDAAAAGANMAPYPLLAAEVGITAPDAFGVATVVLAKQLAWWSAAASIERVRRSAKVAVNQATTTAAVLSILQGVAWPSSMTNVTSKP